MSKLVIAGGRDFIGTEDDFHHIDDLCDYYEITEIVSGKAKGADLFGEECANRLNIPVKPFPADWDNLEAPGAIIRYTKYGKPYNAKAGTDRNEQMAIYTDYVHLFPGGSGTKSMHDLAIKYHKPLI